MLTSRCRSKYHCVAHTSDGPALTTRPNTICPPCIEDIQKRLDELPHLADVLKLFKAGGLKAKGSDVPVSGSREPSTPLDINIITLIEDIEMVRDMAGGYQIRDLIMHGSLDFMIWVRDALIQVELDGVDRALRVRRVHQRASKAVGLQPVWSKLSAPCPDCLLPTLGQWGGSDIVDCRNCDLKMPQATYEDYCWAVLKKKVK